MHCFATVLGITDFILVAFGKTLLWFDTNGLALGFLANRFLLPPGTILVRATLVHKRWFA